MGIFSQDTSHLLGSPQAIASLAQAESATLLLLSDSHGSFGTLQLILREQGEAIGEPKPDALIFCGDGMGDICGILTKAAEDEAFALLVPPIIGVVEGNMDSDEYTVYTPACTDGGARIRVPLTQTLTACGHKLFFTHGHRFSLYNGTQYLAQRAREVGAELVAYGHTHIPRAENTLAMLTVNPGSCSLPRGGMPPSYALLKLKRNSALFDVTFYRITGKLSEPFIPRPSSFR